MKLHIDTKDWIEGEAYGDQKDDTGQIKIFRKV